MARIAIIGAGLAGLVTARELGAAHDVSVFEKSRGVGGRMATRYAGDFEFDHGAQFFTARTDAFRRYLTPMVDAGVVADWPASFAELRRSEILSRRHWDEGYPHFVGVPRMNTVCKWLADGVDISLDTTVARTSRRDEGWRLFDSNDEPLGDFDWMILTAPASQTAAFVPGVANIVSRASTAGMQACFALMLGFPEYRDLPWQAALVRDADLSWISVNSSKSGRKEPCTIVAHSTNAWADAHIDDSVDSVRAHMLSEFGEVTGIQVRDDTFVDIQRWRFANTPKQDKPACIVLAEERVAACGDWFVRGRVEGAFTSASALLAELAELL